MLYKGIMEDTPVGRLTLIAEDNYLIRVDFEKEDNSQFVKYLTSNYEDYVISPGLSGELIKAMAQLEEYFSGRRKSFDLNIKLFGTQFYQKCWSLLCSIPYGETRSYKELAAQAGNPNASRAVGQANHHNPIPVIIPCHRVVTHDRKLGGFGGGLDKKQTLLDIERKNK